MKKNSTMLLCVWYGSCFSITCSPDFLPLSMLFSVSACFSHTHSTTIFFLLSLSLNIFMLCNIRFSLSATAEKKSKIELSWVFFLFSFIATRLWTTTRSSVITHFYIYSSIQLGRSGARERAIESRRAPKKKIIIFIQAKLLYNIRSQANNTPKKKAEKKIVRTKHTFFLPSKKLRSLIRLSFCWEKHAAAETSWIKKIFGRKKRREVWKKQDIFGDRIYSLCRFSPRKVCARENYQKSHFSSRD